MPQRSLEGGLRLSRRERLEAWALTGPPGRAWSFARDLASAAPLVARYWGARGRDRLLRRERQVRD
ncbi:MAG TPA: hypothetical protein VHH72_03070 [Solirubrobacterales bacterium]|jgi:hypothetical protein|nr:hypothetical protein [Solirubrobacterales bacterium]